MWHQLPTKQMNIQKQRIQITNKYLDSTGMALPCVLFHNNELRVWRKILQRFEDARVVDGRASLDALGNGGVAVLQKHISNVIKHYMRFAEESRLFVLRNDFKFVV